MTDPNDPRWGDYVPWFFRYQNFAVRGNIDIFFARVSQRLHRLLYHNEANLPSKYHFISQLESESLQRFRQVGGEEPHQVLSSYFQPQMVDQDIRQRHYDAHQSWLASHRGTDAASEWKMAQRERQLAIEHDIICERIGVLEAVLRLLPSASTLPLIRDIRRIFAEADLILDIRTDNGIPQIVPIEEPLLQHEIIDQLLPRLAAQFPERAKELVSAYRGLLNGEDADTIFVGAFKSLEELARELSGDRQFIFDKKHLTEHFPHLHGTIHITLMRLSDHRGDKGGHGKDAPSPHEIRYLLFAICNAALLLLDYPKR